MSKGYVYVLSNPSMPGVVKVGKTKRCGRDRAAELWTTGVPEHFVVEFEILTAAYAQIESAAHERLKGHRVHAGREFFRVSPEQAEDAIVACVVEYRGGYVSDSVEWDMIGACIELADAHGGVNEFGRSDVAGVIENLSPEGVKEAVSLYRNRLAEGMKRMMSENYGKLRPATECDNTRLSATDQGEGA